MRFIDDGQGHTGPRRQGRIDSTTCHIVANKRLKDLDVALLRIVAVIEVAGIALGKDTAAQAGEERGRPSHVTGRIFHYLAFLEIERLALKGKTAAIEGEVLL